MSVGSVRTEQIKIKDIVLASVIRIPNFIGHKVSSFSFRDYSSYRDTVTHTRHEKKPKTRISADYKGPPFAGQWLIYPHAVSTMCGSDGGTELHT